MAFNAYLRFDDDSAIKGESTSTPDGAPAKDNFAIEVADYGFGASMPVTTSRSDGGGATVGRANFDVFTATKNIDTATTDLFKFCCKGTDIKAVILHLYRAGEGTLSGTVKYATVVFQHCVVTKVAISGSGEELPKESMEFNYGLCEYAYQLTDHNTGKPKGSDQQRFGWSCVKNMEVTGLQPVFTDWLPKAPAE